MSNKIINSDYFTVKHIYWLLLKYKWNQADSKPKVLEYFVKRLGKGVLYE